VTDQAPRYHQRHQSNQQTMYDNKFMTTTTALPISIVYIVFMVVDDFPGTKHTTILAEMIHFHPYIHHGWFSDAKETLKDTEIILYHPVDRYIMIIIIFHNSSSFVVGNNIET
jgi:hypothetical protein